MPPDRQKGALGGRSGLRGLLAVALVAAALSGCAVGYYAHLARGGLDLLVKRRPIARVLRDPATPADLRERLERVLRIREFAVGELGLPDNRSYLAYAALGRERAAWNVVAAGELAIEPVTWCFPIAGCVTYRGYFSRRRAERFAARLAGKGLDVDVGGVTAFSTLGRLRDPVLDTFVFLPEEDLAALLVHELAHQRVYVRDDTAFNESFATAVEREGVRRWLAAAGDGERVAAYLDRLRREDAFADRVLETRERLAAVYAEPRPDDWKRRRKAEILEELRQTYLDSEDRAGSRFDAWLGPGLNNARLAAFGAYHDRVPAFAALLERHGGDLASFYADVERLARLPAEARRAELRSIGPSAR